MSAYGRCPLVEVRLYLTVSRQLYKVLSLLSCWEGEHKTKNCKIVSASMRLKLRIL